MIFYPDNHINAGQEYYEERYRSRVVQNLKQKVWELWFELVKMRETVATM
uniref:Uncharacterized protein n=1 Tax=uncultured Desulfobacterium sp. TaxID=201089 RepID=E1YEV9_9BACT|nr:unknown protein [uncultured Desulfobacterium sp.]